MWRGILGLVVLLWGCATSEAVVITQSRTYLAVCPDAARPTYVRQPDGTYVVAPASPEALPACEYVDTHQEEWTARPEEGGTRVRLVPNSEQRTMRGPVPAPGPEDPPRPGRGR